MRRKKPLRQKTPLRRKTPLKRTGRLRPYSQSPKKVAKRKLYEKNRKEYLAEHLNCEICGHSGRRDLHHKAGRTGKSLNEDGEMEFNLTNKLTFMAVCRICHEYLHRNPKESRERGWLVRG